MSILTTTATSIGEIISAYGAIGGAIAFVWACADRAARFTPWVWDNKVVQAFSRLLYYFFAIIAMKPPNIIKMDFENKQIVTTQQAVASQAIQDQVKPQALNPDVQPIIESKPPETAGNNV